MDRPVVRQKDVGDAGQALESVVVVVGDRLVGAVAAGHDQRPAGQAAKQQMVQRRVGQHDAQEGIAGRDCLGDGDAGPLAEQHDRAARRA